MSLPERKSYLTVFDIKNLTGKSVQSIHKRLDKLGCTFRNIQGRGKPRKEYLLVGLPGEIQNLYLSTIKEEFGLKKSETDITLPVPAQKNLPATKPTDIASLICVQNDSGDPWDKLPEASRNKAYELLGVVNRVRDLQANSKRNKVKILKEYCEREGKSHQSVYRYLKIANEAKAAAIKSGVDPAFAQIKALTPQYGANKNQFRSFSREAIFFACNQYLNQKHLNLKDVYKETVNTGIAEGWKIGSYDSLREIINRIDPATKTLARKGMKQFEALHTVKILRNYDEILPNFMWCGDHHIFDVFVKIPDGKGGWTFKRPWLTAWMDMRSRSFMGWVISFQPNSMTIAQALAHAILSKNDAAFPQCGLPGAVYIDNGKDYRCKYLNGEEIKIGQIDYPEIIEKYAALGIDPFYIDLEYDPKENAYVKKRGQKEHIVKGVQVGGVFAKLGIQKRFAIVYHPWAKPIERAFRNVVQGFSPQLPGWCGSGHEQRPEKLKFELNSGNVLTLNELCHAWHGWVVNEYHKQPHRGHGMNGLSPNEVFTSLMPSPITVEPKLLYFALLKNEKVKLHNWGFQLLGNQYQLDLPVNLQGGLVANHLIGQYISVHYDTNFRMIRVYKDGDYICDGKPLQRASFITEDNSVMVEKIRLQNYQKKASKAVLSMVSSESRQDVGSEADALLKLTLLGDSQDSVGAVLQLPIDDEDDQIPLTKAERYDFILKKLAKGKALSQDDQEFKDEFEESDEYKESKQIFEGDFGYYKHQFEKRGAIR